MNTKKAVAGSIIALLLVVTSVAAACDVSCAFGLASADCHSGDAPSGSSMSAAMDMGGMDMSEMVMPGVNQGQIKAPNAGISRTSAPHPSIGDMGPCERQSCDKASFVFVKGQRSESCSAPSISLRAAITITGISWQVFRDARDDVVPFSSFTANAPTLTLRI
jgi:hypothetical protein